MSKPNNPDPISYPIVAIGSKSFEVKLTCETLFRVKKEHGINLFALPPKDRAGQKYSALLLQAATVGDESERTRLLKEAEELEPKISDEFRNWRHPLDGELLDRLDVYAAIVAVAIKMDKDSVIAELQLDQVQDLFDVIGEALKKVQTRSAKPVTAK